MWLRFRSRSTLRSLLVVVFVVALGVRAWSLWLTHRTEQVFQSFERDYARDTAGHRQAAQAIVAIGGGRASVPPLIEALRSGDPGKQFAAGQALAEIGPDAAGAVPALIELLGSPDLYARQLAPGALAMIGPAARPAWPALRRALDDREWLIRTNAARALVKIDPEKAPRVVVPVLRTLLHHPDPMARAEASRILSEPGL